MSSKAFHGRSFSLPYKIVHFLDGQKSGTVPPYKAVHFPCRARLFIYDRASRAPCRPRLFMLVIVHAVQGSSISVPHKAFHFLDSRVRPCRACRTPCRPRLFMLETIIFLPCLCLLETIIFLPCHVLPVLPCRPRPLIFVTCTHRLSASSSSSTIIITRFRSIIIIIITQSFAFLRISL